jgi:transketolase
MRIDPAKAKWEDRDRFMLSKGHAAPVLYSVMAERGYADAPKDKLNTLRRFGSVFQGHPDMRFIPSLEASTGSLGQGLSLGLGMALGARLDGRPSRFFVMLGDGEIQEGQIWEAAMAAAFHKADNLVAIVDYNRIQLDGFVSDIMKIAPVVEKWRQFGWHAVEIDGHELAAIEGVLAAAAAEGKPTCIVAHTLHGKSASLKENNPQVPRRRADATRIGAPVNADLSKSTMTTYFAKEFPGQFFSCGIAQSNMAGIGASLAMAGKIPFIASFNVFVLNKGFEQLRTGAAYEHSTLKVVGTHSGISRKDDAPQRGVEENRLACALPGIVVTTAAEQVATLVRASSAQVRSERVAGKTIMPLTWRRCGRRGGSGRARRRSIRQMIWDPRERREAIANAEGIRGGLNIGGIDQLPVSSLAAMNSVAGTDRSRRVASSQSTGMRSNMHQDGGRDYQWKPSRKTRRASKSLRIFVVHGRNHKIVEQVKGILHLCDFEVELAVERETCAIAVPEKIDAAMKRCQGAVIIVTPDFPRKGGTDLPINHNVLIEIGMAYQLYRKRMVLLWDKRLRVPSDLQGLYRFEVNGDDFPPEEWMRLGAAIKELRNNLTEEGRA